ASWVPRQLDPGLSAIMMLHSRGELERGATRITCQEVIE
ncbi:MAG: hypothetical protein QOG14_3860, partial [Mycobacterium sp.]|nr:hypothetical protein [Mycobacterium sp.]